jgi:hypothetical protein
MTDIPSPGHHLSLTEHAVLLWVLCALPDRGEAELLYEQSVVAKIHGGPLTMRELAIPASARPASILDGPLPVRAFASDEIGNLLGELLVWVSDGYLSTIEYAWYTDSVPTELPAPSQLREG